MKIKKQEDIKDCGLVVVQSLFHHFNNQWISINRLKEDAYFDNDGIVIKNLQNLAIKWGISLEAYNIDFVSFSELKINEPFVTIINENNYNHYVIITNKTNKYIEFLDPLIGKRKMKIEEFKNVFINIIISAKKEFDIKYKENSSFIKHILKDPKNAYFLLVMVIISILNFSSSFFLKNILDRVFPFNNLDLLIKLSIVFVWIFLFRFSQNLIKSFFVKKLQMIIERDITLNFLHSLKGAQNSQLLKIDITEYLKRFSVINSYSSFNANFVFSLFSDAATFLFSMLILAWINFYIFLIAIAVSLVYFGFSVIFKKLISKKYNVILKKNAEVNSAYFDIVNNVLKLKNDDIQKALNTKFLNKLKNLKQEDFNFWKNNFVFSQTKLFINEILPLIIIIFSSVLILRSQMQIGEMILFTTFFSSFINPLNNLSDLSSYYPIFKQEEEMLKFILEIPKEINGTQNIEKIASIEINNLDYKANNIKTILKINELKISENTQITGKNGTGKTTLLKILNQDIENNSNIKINNLELQFINKEELRKKVIYLSNEINSYSSSVLEFITDSSNQKMNTFLENVSFYNFAVLLQKWQIDLKSDIKPQWSNFSSGQKSIILLLKLFSQKYDVILLDEIFENLSPENFEIISKIIKDFQGDSIFIEVSHSKRYLYKNKEVDLEKLK
ncbi:Mbov_0121 family peptidase domain-containing ABC transporter [Mycoplasma procyoni]|uniref:Mbov_0121 family peptidase domain-containing ABC transporter n=1 Tax=Mycoplasma procyoni TaxID=568784 RepID=UPI00197B258D|nr:cysteine peptidase family C39 domain-containing protein [Mycoplasma procyoni]MBN3535103.1 ATP-binding cassette domain-containing protein [Mycoplasma procyoni]